MTAFLLILEILAALLKIAAKAVDTMTPEQLTPFLERHEQRMAFWEDLAQRFKGDV